MGGFKRTTGGPLAVRSVLSGVQDAQVSAGEGVGITFENPLITQSMVDDIYTKVNGLTYTPCTLTKSGDPSVCAGDTLTVYDASGYAHTVLVMSQKIKLSGGCVAEITCDGRAEADIQLSAQSPTERKLKHMYSTFEESIVRATQAITGQLGGYFVIHYTQFGVPYEVLFMDDPDIYTAQNVWRWNMAGLGFSSTGYDGVYKLAITADGHINADFIDVGTLSASLVFAGILEGAQGTFVSLTAGLAGAQRIDMGTNEHNDPFLNMYDNQGALTLSLRKDALQQGDFQWRPTQRGGYALYRM